MDTDDAALDMLDERHHRWHAGAIGVRAVWVPAKRRWYLFEHNAAASKIPGDDLGRGNALTPERKRPRGSARRIVRIIIAARWCSRARPIVGSALIEQSARAQFGEYIEPVAPAPAGNQHTASVAVAQHQTAATVQRAPATPGASLPARIAERYSNLGGSHDMASRAHEGETGLAGHMDAPIAP
jgi:hypothetical protein